MNRLLLAFLLCVTVAAPPALAQAQAQGTDQNTAVLEVIRRRLNGERQALVAAAMDLTRAEADAFWPVYDRYHAELNQVNASNYRIVRTFAEKQAGMSDATAMELVRTWADNQEKAAKIRKKYIKDFGKALPPVKLVRYVQVENKIDAAVAQAFAEEIPLIEQLNRP